MVEAINFAVINVKVHGTCCQWHLLSVAPVVSGTCCHVMNCVPLTPSRNKVRGDTCAENSLALIDEPGASVEPERLGHISLGLENPRMRMNAAPG